MIIVSLIWSHLQQTLRVDQRCYWYCRLWCRLLSTVASCSSRQLQVNWISSARILSFHPRPIRYIRRVAQTGRKTTTTPRRVSNQKEQRRQRGQIDKLDYTSICASHPNILPILSRDCHITRQVTVWSV